MKRLYIYLTTTLLLTGCSSNSLLDDEPQAPLLTIDIRDEAGFCSGSGSRTAEQGYTTTFTDGDACGLYIVTNGIVSQANIKLTARTDAVSGKLSWTTETPIRGGYDSELYFLYYPYHDDADMADKTAQASDAISFFRPLIEGWTPANDQSIYENYTASDLMISKGAVTQGNKLTFTMSHSMAMAVIDAPYIIYDFNNPEITSEYKVTTNLNFTNENTPYLCDGQYRYLFNPTGNTSLSGYSNDDQTFFGFNLNGESGKTTTYVIKDSQIVLPYNLQVGDYFMNDGTIISKNEALTDERKDKCIGIVFHVGHNQYDACDYSTSGIGRNRCHGYVTALNDGAGDKAWGKEQRIYKFWPIDSEGNTIRDPAKDWDGYRYLLSMRNSGLGEFPAAQAATENTAPRYTTGWFLPSVGQFLSLTNIDFTALGSKLTGAYWTSSVPPQYSMNSTRVVDARTNAVNDNAPRSTKWGLRNIRPILIF